MRHRKLEDKCRMYGNVYKNTLRACVRNQQAGEFINPTCNFRALAARCGRVSEHSRLRNRFFGPKAVLGRYLIGIAAKGKVINRCLGDVQCPA